MDFVTGLLASLRRPSRPPMEHEPTTPEIPAELLRQMMGQLGARDLVRAGEVSREWHTWSDDIFTKTSWTEDFTNEVFARGLTQPKELWDHDLSSVEILPTTVVGQGMVLGIDKGHKLHAFDLASGKALAKGDEPEVADLRFNGQRISAHDTTTGEEIVFERNGEGLRWVRAARETQSGRYTISWKLKDASKEAELLVTEPGKGERRLCHSTDVKTLNWWSLEGDRLCVCLGDTLHVADLTTDRWQELIKDVSNTSLHVYDGYLWARNRNGLQRWNLQTLKGEIIDSLAQQFYTSSDSRIAVTVDTDVKVWDLKTGKVQHSWRAGTVMCAALMGSEAVVTGDNFGNITFWSLQGKQLLTFNPFEQAVSHLAVSNGHLHVKTWTHRAAFDVVPADLRAKVVKDDAVAGHPVIV